MTKVISLARGRTCTIDAQPTATVPGRRKPTPTQETVSETLKTHIAKDISYLDLDEQKNMQKTVAACLRRLGNQMPLWKNVAKGRVLYRAVHEQVFSAALVLLLWALC